MSVSMLIRKYNSNYTYISFPFTVIQISKFDNVLYYWDCKEAGISFISGESVNLYYCGKHSYHIKNIYSITLRFPSLDLISECFLISS